MGPAGRVLSVGATADVEVLLVAVPAACLCCGHTALGELGCVHEAEEVLGRRLPAVLELLGRRRRTQQIGEVKHQLTCARVEQRPRRDRSIDRMRDQHTRTVARILAVHLDLLDVGTRNALLRALLGMCRRRRCRLCCCPHRWICRGCGERRRSRLRCCPTLGCRSRLWPTGRLCAPLGCLAVVVAIVVLVGAAISVLEAAVVCSRSRARARRNLKVGSERGAAPESIAAEFLDLAHAHDPKPKIIL